MSWRVANSLDVLLDEINKAAPNRSKVSDGSIGDAAHASRDSDHNPWVIDNHGVGVVRARDYTHDPSGGLDCDLLAAYLVDRIGEHPALTAGSYVIRSRRIYSFDRRSEGWRPYSGSNPHDHHLHLSVATSQSGYDSTAPWGWGEPEEDMATYADWSEADKTAAAEAAAKAFLATKIDVGRPGSKDDRDVEQILRELWNKRNV